MEKIIKKWGSSLVVTLDKEDIQIYGLKEGDIIDFKIIKINKKEENENGERSETNNPELKDISSIHTEQYPKRNEEEISNR